MIYVRGHHAVSGRAADRRALMFEEREGAGMALSSTPGYPRIGRDRELKRACEAYWKGALSAEDLHGTAAELRRAHWQAQRAAGIDLIPCNDFSFYDMVLDAVALIGAVPPRYHWDGQTVDLDIYFAMARGAQRAGLDVTAMEMTKWFDTNYHYIVPEWHSGQRFRLASGKPFDELAEAQAQGVPAKPVLVGPLTLVLLGKAQDEGVDLLGATLDGILEVYAQVVERLAAAGATWIQLDEPCLVQDRTPTELAALPVDAIGLDFVRGPQNLALLRRYGLPEELHLAAGVVDGRNVWRADLDAALTMLEDVADMVRPEHILVTPSCSLLHVPYDATRETSLNPELRGWLAFAEQKLAEVVTLTRGLDEGRAAIAEDLQASAAVQEQRRTSPRVHDPAVRRRMAEAADGARPPFVERRAAQPERLGPPPP